MVGYLQIDSRNYIRYFPELYFLGKDDISDSHILKQEN